MSAKYQAYEGYKGFEVDALGSQYILAFLHVPLPSFLHALSRNLYASNGSPLRACGDDVVGGIYEC